jgi:hypothetical protein
MIKFWLERTSSMLIPIADITEIAVFVHPGQLTSGYVFLVTFHNASPEYEQMLEQYKNAICIYKGPPNGKTHSA